MDLSRTSKGRVVFITVAGTLFTLVTALLTVSYTTQFMPDDAEAMTWTAAFVLPLVLTTPMCFYFANTLRRLAIAHDELTVVAARDSLTTCLNRGAFLTLVDAYLRDVHEDTPNGAMLVVDADHFKAINDRFGHGAGDDALRLIAIAMQSVVRPIDLVGRIGGEEFAIFMPRIDRPTAHQVAERVRQAVSASVFVPNGQRHLMSVSVGAVLFAGRIGIDTLLARADDLLYAAKDGGRDRVEFGPEVLAA